MRKAFFYFTIFLFLSLFLNACEKESNPVNPGNPNPAGTGATRSFTSAENGSLDYDGFSLVIKTETVPRLQSNASGTVAFSINTSSTIDSGIPGLPAGYSLISKYLKAGPKAFYFNLPVQ